MSRPEHLRPAPRSAREVLRSLATLPHWHALRTYSLAQHDWMTSRRTRTAAQFGSPVPWWSYGCTSFLDQVVPPNARVLELGGGGSTSWWLERGNSVTVIEPNAAWAERIRSDSARFADRLELMRIDPDAPGALEDGLGDAVFDVVVVDHSGDRNGAVRALIPRVADDGVLILDNADRPEHAVALATMSQAGFARLDFFDLGPINAFSGLTVVGMRGALQVRGRPAAHTRVDN